jgi:autotransporter-associated beta strand protein
VAGSIYLGYSSTGTYNLNGGVLVVSGIDVSSNADFNLGGGTLKAGAAFSTSQSLTLSGSGENTSIDTSGYAVTLAGPLSGPGGLNKAGNGALTLAGSNTYKGGTTIGAGTLKLGVSAALPSGAAATVNGTLDLGSFGATVGALTGAGTVNHSGAGSSTLTVGSGNAAGDFSGTIENTGGTLALLKTGSGELILSGSDGYTGGTAVNAGELYVMNSSALAKGTSLIVGAGSKFLSDPAMVSTPSASGPSVAAPDTNAATVPEPGTLALLSTAGIVAGATVWRRRRN